MQQAHCTKPDWFGKALTTLVHCNFSATRSSHLLEWHSQDLQQPSSYIFGFGIVSFAAVIAKPSSFFLPLCPALVPSRADTPVLEVALSIVSGATFVEIAEPCDPGANL